MKDETIIPFLHELRDTTVFIKPLPHPMSSLNLCAPRHRYQVMGQILDKAGAPEVEWLRAA